MCLNIKIYKYNGLKLNEVIFTHLEVVGRCSEIQLQVGENLNYLI